VRAITLRFILHGLSAPVNHGVRLLLGSNRERCLMKHLLMLVLVFISSAYASSFDADEHQERVCQTENR
jgi:hypothetical protein